MRWIPNITSAVYVLGPGLLSSRVNNKTQPLFSVATRKMDIFFLRNFTNTIVGHRDMVQQSCIRKYLFSRKLLVHFIFRFVKCNYYRRNSFLWRVVDLIRVFFCPSVKHWPIPRRFRIYVFTYNLLTESNYIHRFIQRFLTARRIFLFCPSLVTLVRNSYT